MKKHICYCAVDGARGEVRNRDNTAGAPPPELVMGLPCELRLRLFANCADTTPYPPAQLAEVVSWSFAMDNDFSPQSTVKLVAGNADIALAEVAENGVSYTQITIPLPETRTTELAAALDGKESIRLDGELIGYDSGHEEAFVLQIRDFTVRGRLTGLGDSLSVLSAVCEAMAEDAVNALLVSGGYVVSSGAELIASGAVAAVSSALISRIAAVSGGLTERPTSSGAEAIASGAALNVLSGAALPKDAPFSTTVGDYSIVYNGSDGLSIHEENGATTVIVSSGYIQATAWDEVTEQTTDLLVTNGGITANGVVVADGSAITQARSGVEDTSLEIDVLSGGVKYVCQSALTVLFIGSAAPGCNGTIIFTVANGAVVTPPANVPYFGVTSYTAGSSYLMMINGDAAVCNEAAIVPGV